MNWRLMSGISGTAGSHRTKSITPASTMEVSACTPMPPHPAMPTRAPTILCCPSSPTTGICLSNLLTISPPEARP